MHAGQVVHRLFEGDQEVPGGVCFGGLELIAGVWRFAVCRATAAGLLWMTVELLPLQDVLRADVGRIRHSPTLQSSAMKWSTFAVYKCYLVEVEAIKVGSLKLALFHLQYKFKFRTSEHPNRNLGIRNLISSFCPPSRP